MSHRNRRSVLEDLRGGRAPGQLDQVDEAEEPCGAEARVADGDAAGGGSGKKLKSRWAPTPCGPDEARLTVIQITDCYTLENLASVKTLVAEANAKSGGGRVISVLTGDFLAPYLLSSVDRGNGMMNALAKIPIDYITWGNHEADLSHKTVCRHVREFPGKWLNSNMLDHDAMDDQEEYDVIELMSPDGTNSRQVGLVAVLSDDPNLYKQFKAPGAFGGATIGDPWEALARYKDLLEGPEHDVDTIIPLQHLYLPDDMKTCNMFNFPVILSGHDHHRVDKVVEGTRLLKPGMDAIYATVLEMSWSSKDAGRRPSVKATFAKTSDWKPEPLLQEENERAYDVLMPLRNTELARVPPSFEPLSSADARGQTCTMGKFVCTLLRSSLNASGRQRWHLVDAVLLMGGNIRAGVDYPVGSFFSLEALEAEVKSDEVVAVVPMPGWLLSKGVGETHSGDPIPGWMQYDEGIVEDNTVSPPRVTDVRGRPIEMDHVYRVATKISDLTNGQCPSWTIYYKERPELLPPKGAYVNIHAELMQFFASSLWRRIWDGISISLLKEECDPEEDQAERRLSYLDSDHTGVVSVEEIQLALSDLAGFSVDDRELSLAKFIHNYADTNGTGEVTLDDMRTFCDEMPEVYERDKWRSGFPKTHRSSLSAPSESMIKLAELACSEHDDLVHMAELAGSEHDDLTQVLSF